MARKISDEPAAGIEQAIAALRAGEVVAIPTDTVYGLAASLDHPLAIERIYEIKGREATKAIPVLVDSAQRLFDLAEVDQDIVSRVANVFWPGALTLVVKWIGGHGTSIGGVVVDGGRTPGGRASTVVDLTSGQPRILRQGAITLDEIEQVMHESSIEE